MPSGEVSNGCPSPVNPGSITSQGLTYRAHNAANSPAGLRVAVPVWSVVDSASSTGAVQLSLDFDAAHSDMSLRLELDTDGDISLRLFGTAVAQYEIGGVGR